jgi:hypothetical protein
LRVARLESEKKRRREKMGKERGREKKRKERKREEKRRIPATLEQGVCLTNSMRRFSALCV